MTDQNEIEVKVTGSTGDLENDITSVETKVKNAAKGMRDSANIIKTAFNSIKNTLKNIEVKIHVDTAELQNAMQGVVNTVRAQVQAAGNAASVKIKVDGAELSNIRNQINSSMSGTNGIKLKIDRSHLQAELNQIRTRINAFFATSIQTIQLKISVTQTELAAARAKLRSLTSTIFKAKIGIDLTYLNSQIAHARAMLGAVGGSLNINIDATATGLITALNNLKSEIVRLIAAINSNGGGGGGGGGSGGLGAIFGGNLAAMVTGFITSQFSELSQALITTSDNAALLNTRMLDLLNTEQAVVEVKEQLYTAAQRLAVGYQDMASATARMIPSLQEMKKGAGDAVKLAEILMVTAKLSGASTMEAASSAQQFSQALGSGVLQGDELKSILENNQSLARALANALKLPDASTKVTIGMLKDLGAEGKITSKVLADALLNSYDTIMAKADQLPTTFSGTWQQIKNIAFKTIDDLNQTDFFGGVKGNLKDLATKLEQFSKDGTLKEWATDIGGVLSEVGSLFMELLGIVGDVVGEISTLWQDLAGAVDESTGAQIGFFELLKNSIKVVHVVFIGLRTGIQIIMAGIKAVVQDTLMLILAGFSTLRAGINIAVIGISGYVESLISLLKTLASVAVKALQLDFSGAISAWDAGTNKIAGIVKNKAQLIANETKQMKMSISVAADGSNLLNGNFLKKTTEITQNARQKIDDVILGNSNFSMPKGSATNTTSSTIDRVAVGAGKGKEGKDKKSNADAEAKARQRAAEKEAQAIADIRYKYASEEEKIALDLNKALSEIEKSKVTDAEKAKFRIVVEKEASDKTIALRVKEFDEFKRLQDALIDNKMQIAQRSYEIDMANIQAEFDAKKLSNLQKYLLEKELEDKLRELKRRSLEERLELENQMSEKSGKPGNQNQILSTVSGLDTEKKVSDTKSIGLINEAELKDFENRFGELTSRMSSLWDQGIQSMMNGTLTWRNATNAVLTDMASFALKTATKELQGWMKIQALKLARKLGFVGSETAIEATGQAAQTGAVVVGESARTAATAAGGLARLAIKAGQAIKSIMMSAVEAMANAFAQLPYPMNLVAGPAMFAVVAGLTAKVASARGGYDIPSGVNPMTQLHEEEMVLPKQHANTIRALGKTVMGDGSLSQTTPAASGDSGSMQPINIQAWDTKDIKRFMKKHGRELAGGLKGYGRNFGR